MNKNTIKILSLVAGILVASIALFDLIADLISLGNFPYADINDGKYTAYFVITLIISIVAVVFYAIVGAFIIKAYVKKTEEEKYMEFPVLIYHTFGIIGSLIAMIFWGFDNGTAWVRLIFTVAGLVLLCLVRYSNMENNTKNILRLVSIGLAFILSIYGLSSSNGISIVINLVFVSLFVIIFLYYLFKFIMNDKKQEEIVQ